MKGSHAILACGVTVSVTLVLEFKKGKLEDLK